MGVPWSRRAATAAALRLEHVHRDEHHERIPVVLPPVVTPLPAGLPPS
jgi:hypothetical protein